MIGRVCGGNHHPGSIPSLCGNYPASSGHQSGTGFDPAKVKPSRVKWTAAWPDPGKWPAKRGTPGLSKKKKKFSNLFWIKLYLKFIVCTIPQGHTSSPCSPCFNFAIFTSISFRMDGWFIISFVAIFKTGYHSLSRYVHMSNCLCSLLNSLSYSLLFSN